MKKTKKLNLFISYSHEDEETYIDEFRQHIVTLKNNDLIEDRYDSKILPGKDYQKAIDNKLDDAYIICLFTSANYLSSDNCQKEKKKAIELRKRKGTQVIPIIISPCAWQDDEEISSLLALPTDGEPVSSFKDRNEVWVDVYEGLKKIIEEKMKIKHLKIKRDFEKFLKDVELLTKDHPQKETVFLDDMFIAPDLDAYDELREFD